jgi:hypothetical protein
MGISPTPVRGSVSFIYKHMENKIKLATFAITTGSAMFVASLVIVCIPAIIVGTLLKLLQ